MDLAEPMEELLIKGLSLKLVWKTGVETVQKFLQDLDFSVIESDKQILVD